MATTEVAEAVGAVPGFSDVNVYGVEIPNCDGKVGMACVVLTDGVTERCARMFVVFFGFLCVSTLLLMLNFCIDFIFGCACWDGRSHYFPGPHVFYIFAIRHNQLT